MKKFFKFIIFLGFIFMYIPVAFGAELGPTVAISPDGGYFTNDVTINFDTNQYRIVYTLEVYTLDSSQPTTISNILYTDIGYHTLEIRFNRFFEPPKTVVLRYYAQSNTGEIGPEVTKYFYFDSEPAITSATSPTGMYRSPQTVFLSTNKSATIYYTLDGSQPTKSSPVYDGSPINVNADMIIKAFSIDNFGMEEDVRTFEYIIDPNAPEIVPIIAQTNNQRRPHIWDNKLVYRSDETGNFEIYLKDLSDGTTTQITNGGVDTYNIDYQGGNIIVWQGGTQIFAYNLSDGTTRQITTGSNKVFFDSKVSGDNIVFTGAEEGVWDNDIYVYNYSSNTLNQLSRPGTQGQPRIDGNKVIWLDYSDESGGLYLYDLTTHIETKLNNSALDADLSGSRVVYNTVSEGMGELHAIDLIDGKDRLIYSESNLYTQDLEVQDNQVVWANHEDIYVYDFISKTSKRVTLNWINESSPDVHGDKIVWQEDQNDDTNISMTIIPFPVIDTLAPVVSANPKGGTFDSPQNITLQDDEPSIIYYTTDGNNPTTNSPIYMGPITISNTTTLKFMAVDRAGNQSPITSEIYSIPSSDTTPPTVTASPAGGTYNSAQTVTLTADEPADIYYTVDGSDPTTASPLYTGPITINSTTTLKFMAVDRAGNKSTISTTNYTLQYPTQLAYTGLLSATKDSTVTLTASLTAVNGGPSDLSGREIIFTLGSQTVSALTDAAGNATAALTLSQAAGNYPFTAVYNGDAALLGSTYAGTFYITAGNSNNVKPNVSMDPIVVTPDANGQTYTATITGTVDQGAAVEVSVSINHGTPVVYQAVVNGTTWSYTIANLAKNDQVRIEAIAKDAIGNTSLPAKDNIKVR